VGTQGAILPTTATNPLEVHVETSTKSKGPDAQRLRTARAGVPGETLL
jgi:hypothetical protein